MRLKWWFKVNQNLLYKKYIFDPHGYLIRRAHITKTVKFLIETFYFRVIKKLYVRRLKRDKYIKRFEAVYRRKKWNWKHGSLARKRKNLAKKFLKNWNYNFWNKFKNNYFNKSFSNLRQSKYSSFFFLKIMHRKIDNRFSKGFNILKNLLGKKVGRKKKKRVRSIFKRRITKKNLMKIKRKKLMKAITWLRIIRYKRKKKDWWWMRITNKKAAFFYGIIQLKKFRYINNLNSRNIPLTTYYSHKLECMLNIVLFRLNFFDNIFITNNFIRISGIVLINNTRVLYPFRFVKVGDVISFHPYYFKRMFNIFYKRSKFNKTFIIKTLISKKKIKKVSVWKLLKCVKNFLNVPAHIEYNYKIMHFLVWRLPHENEFLSMNFRFFNTHIWAFETQLQYN